MATATVRGRASADVEPDRVRLVLAVQAEAVTGAEALELVAARAADVDGVLDRAGDLVLLRRPAAVTVTATWSDSREITGHLGRRAVVVEARVDGPLGRLLAALAAVPGSSVEQTEWIVERGNAVHARLRTAAVLDARDRALDYARAADLRLGALESISEPEVRPGEPGWVPQATMALGFAGGATPPTLELRPEPVPVAAAVDVRYALLGG